MIGIRNIILTAFLTVFVCGMSSAADETELHRLTKRTAVWLDSVSARPDWLSSRLQMYWSTQATDVFVIGEAFSHVGGGQAPVPTVKYNGTRSNASSYNRPRLEDIVPYDDDEQGSVTYINRSTGQMERTHPSKTGCNIASVNRQILGIARDAARIYAATGDVRYGDMAFGVFDVFMRGIYYRNVPVDLNHGHQQTLVGMTTFEVIHEDAVNETTDIYSLLKQGGLEMNDCELYDAAFKKWADNIIDNGVPHNNWNLFQAEFVARIACVLGADTCYADGRGREYYMEYITGESSGIRQWSMKRMADFGFDDDTAIWYESPGYSTTVTGLFSDFANRMDRDAGLDIFGVVPVLERSVFASAQYLMPNRMICGFGDTHPGYLSTRAADALLDYARRHGRLSLADSLEHFRKAVSPDAPDSVIGGYVSPLFYAPNVSWLIQRTGMNPRHDLCISLNGSLGNHQHANGISMELYGKGYVLGPDAGIGRSLYSGLDYAEYYSQMPAHNTVCVDGISSYPVMMSNHAFKVEGRYPAENDTRCSETAGKTECTYSQVSFREPESGADQLRTNGIVKTSAIGGYYVDIFRSNGRKLNDYFYHNLGQSMTLTAADGTDIGLSPTDELAFAGGHLYAYSYIYDKVSARTEADVKATFDIDGGPRMTMWMQGMDGREVFKALSPVNMEYERIASMPYKVDEQPVLTFVARQHGEAWQRPFVAVFEPSETGGESSEIESVEFFRPDSKEQSVVGICVRLKSGRTDYIFSAPRKTKMKYNGMKVDAAYAVISDGRLLISQ